LSTVRFENVTKVYDEGTADETVAVRDLSLDVEDGSLLVLVGPSGCGKSTTLRMLAGLEEVSDGRIYIGDEDVTHKPPSERNIAMVFQNYALYPHMTVRQNLEAGLAYSTDLPSSTIAEEAESTAELLNISDLMEQRPKELSGGQQQRVALGRAIIRDPRVFLFDEPLSNLDAKLRREMRSEIIRLQRDLGATTIYVTHDQKEALTIGDEIVVMRGGEIVQHGSSEEVYHHPQHQFVAEFIGTPSMNFCRVRLREGDEGVSVDSDVEDGLSFDLSPDRVREGLPDDDVSCTLGIRPEDLLVSGGDDAPVQLELEVEVRESLGKSTLLHAQFDDRDWVVETRLPDPPREGDRMTLRFDSSDVYLFDPDGRPVLTEER